MKKEDLLAMGLTEEQADKVMDGLNGDFVTKSRFNEVNTELKAARTALSERDKQLEELKKVDAAALQAQITQLQADNKQKDADYETLTNTGKLYVLYDDVGRLCLRNINQLKLDLVVDAETGESYTYETSIDSQTYDKIKLFYENDKTGKRELYVAQDSSNISKWGVLQYCEQVKTTTGVQAKANSLLKLYNNRTRSLGLKGVFGDPRVRAGCSIIVSLTLPDMTLCNYMVVHKVTHNFQGERHSMDLTLIGGEFISG